MTSSVPNLVSALVVTLLGAGVAVAACSDSSAPSGFPVKTAPASRHDMLADALADDARAFDFEQGDWLEDLGDAPFYGLAWLSKRVAAGDSDPEGPARRDAAVSRARTLIAGNLLEGDIQERVMAALGLIDYAAVSGDQTVAPELDDFVDRLDSLAKVLGDYIEAGADRSWALRTYGPTAITALVALVEAQHALFLGGPRRQERVERVIAIDAAIRSRALANLVDGTDGRTVRGYAFSPDKPGLFDYPNLAMLLLKARLYRLTRDEVFRLEARTLYVALQPLKLTDSPARYSSPYAKASLGIDSRDLSTLSSENYLALGLMLLFEITGETRFIDEADRVLDAIASLRGPWCSSQVLDPAGCAPACASGQACRSAGCVPERCTTGLLHHTVNGRLALPEDGTLFCAGCNLQTLYVLDYRRGLAQAR